MKNTEQPTKQRIYFRPRITVLLTLLMLTLLAVYVLEFKPLEAMSNESCCSGPSVTTQLQSIQSQLELYANLHGGQFPTLAQLQHHWSVFVVQAHDSDGTLQTGPYLQKPPINPLAESSMVAARGQATLSDGWDYDESTGRIRAVIPDASVFKKLKDAGYPVVQPIDSTGR